MRKLVVVASMMFGVIVAGMGQHASAVAESNATLNANLRNGISTSYSWDTSCKTTLQTYGSVRFNALRDVINGSGAYSSSPGASYRNDTWISDAANGNISNPISVTYGTTTIPLRINSVTFLCRPLTQTDLTSGCTNLSVTGSQLASNGRWVTTTDGRETAPNAIGGVCQYPARTLTKANYISVLDTDPLGTTTFVPTTRNWGRESDSRYWFASPLYFSYTEPSGIKTSKTITFSVNYKLIAGYHSTVESSQDQSCGGTVYTPPSTPVSWNVCPVLTSSYSVSVVVTNYNLAPEVILSTPATAVAGDPVSLTSRVTKSGNLTSGFRRADGVTPGSNWRLTKLIYAPGVAAPANATFDTDSDVCTAYVGESTCTQMNSYDNSDGAFAVSQAYQNAVSTSADALPVGSNICYVTSVGLPVPNSANAWRHSAPKCVTIAATPYVAVVGGDASAGGSWSGPPCTGSAGFIGRAPGVDYGSFGEYGVFATGSVVNFSSSGFIPPNSSNGLTFANSPTLGNYSAEHCLSDYAGYYATRVPVASPLYPSGSTIPAGSGIYRATNPIVVQSSMLSTDQKVIIYAPTTKVTLQGPITYTGGNYASFSRAPSLIIIADTIDVAGSVQRLDGLYVAKTRFQTCSDTGFPVTPTVANTASCKNNLTVNGAVITGSGVMTRTSGGDSPASMPSEIFRFRPEVFLTPYTTGESSGMIVTDYIEELPPRY